MAEAGLFDIAGEIIKTLGSQAFTEIGLGWGVKDELEKLSDTVSTIKAVLLDAEDQQKQNNQVTDWLGKLKDAFYDADDLLDDFSTEALRQEEMTWNRMAKKVRNFFSSSNQPVYDHKMGSEVKKIRERLDKIAEDRKKFHFVEKHVENRERKQTHSFVREEAIIGRENDKDEIIKLLGSNVKENVSVITIVGIGGVGKTTLAQLAFNDESVQFDLKMWVCVSHDFDVQIIAEKILESATKSKPEKFETMDTLQSKLREEINRKKYLLVLDDVWNENQIEWDSLQSLLMVGARGSKIVVTTRSKLVAKITRTVSPYDLQGLSNSQSWSLLKKMASVEQEQESNNPQLATIGKEIVKKCVGVPLAIVTIGRVLSFKKTESEWLNVMHNELATITQQEGEILPILKWSYDHLSSHLKHCFAYCSLFPKNYVIDEQTLINLWMAQGFIQSSTGDQQLEDVGHEYFMDLVWRSFFQEVKEDEVGNVKSYKMHDLMHDLARSVAKTECTMVNLDTGIVDKKARHVSFVYSLDSSWKIPIALPEADKVRTLFLRSTQSDDRYNESMVPKKGLNESDCNKIVSTYKCLRALDLRYSKIDNVPHLISKLNHLRYLDVSYNIEIKELPSSISRLHNLQTLNLFDCRELVELPSDIRKMVSLRHLINDGCYGLTAMPEGLGQLTSLRTLSLFVVGKTCRGSGGLRELNGLNNLRGELKIIKLENATSAEAKDANLKAKQYLQSLILDWSLDDPIRVPPNSDENMLNGLEPNPNLKKLSVRRFSGVNFSDWLSSLTNIVEIYLVDCNKCKHLPPLDQLPYLKILDLGGVYDLEYMRSEESSTSRTTTFFPSLKELSLGWCDNLKGWWKKDDGSSEDSTTTTSMPDLPSFPCLSQLSIQECPNLISMPLYPSLEEDLFLSYTSWKPLEETMKMKMNSAAASTSSSSSSSYPLSRLKSLFIQRIQDLESLPEEGLRNLTSLQSLSIVGCPRLMSLPAEGFRGLTSLRSLEIRHCDSLKSLSGVFQHLTALEQLTIYDCEELDLSSEGMQWQGLNSLSSLSIGGFSQLVSLPEGLQHLSTLEELDISNCEELDLSDAGILFKDYQSLKILGLTGIPKLVSLPDWLQHVTTLQRLEIWNCPNFMTLPEWIGNFTSLQELQIDDCPKLTSLPQGMHRLTALQSLEISKCPQLSKRCSNNRGEDWAKITHIPNINIEDRYIRGGPLSIETIPPLLP